MNQVLANIPTTSVPLDRNPAALYLLSLTTHKSRRGMAVKLKRAAAALGLEGDIETLPWQDMRYAHVVGIRSKLIEEGLAPKTVSDILTALRRVAEEAWKLDLMSGDEYHRIKAVKSVRGERLPAGRALSGGELKALMDTCLEDESGAGVRDAALIGVMYSSGLRRAEVVTLAIGDYDTTAQSLQVIGKGNKERLCYIAEGAAAALNDWLYLRGNEEGSLFLPINKGGVIQHRPMTDQAVYKILKKRGKQAGIQSFSPHDLRRSFISDLLDASADISTVQQLAGHASVQTTQRYDRRGEKTKRNAVQLLHLPYRSRK